MFEQYNAEGQNVFVVWEICKCLYSPLFSCWFWWGKTGFVGKSEPGDSVLLIRALMRADDNQAAWDGHLKTEYFGALGAAIQKESLVSVPLDIKTIKPFAGFASR